MTMDAKTKDSMTGDAMTKEAMQGISRRGFVRGTAMVAGGAALAAHPMYRALAVELGNRHLLLIGTTGGRGGTGSKGVYKYAFDSNTGALEMLDVTECNSPQFMALSPDEKYIFTLNGGYLPPGQVAPPPPQPGQPRQRGAGGGGGGVSSWAFNKKTGAMTLINEVSAGGGSGVYICADHTGTCVFQANYGGGSVQSFKVDANGKLSDVVENIKFPPAADGTTSKAHRVTVSPGNGYLLVNDLGLSKIHIFKMDVATAKLTPAGEWLATPGAGSRGFRWHPNKKIGYVVNELAPTLNVVSWDEKTGTLTTLQEVRMVPADYTAAPGKGCAPGDIVFDKKWEHAYVTSRLDDFIGTFTVGKDFKLTLVGHTTSGGVRERDLALDPTDGWLIVANPDSNTVDVMKRDMKTGLLADTATTHLSLGQAQCVIFPARPNVVL